MLTCGAAGALWEMMRVAGEQAARPVQEAGHLPMRMRVLGWSPTHLVRLCGWGGSTPTPSPVTLTWGCRGVGAQSAPPNC